MPSRLAASKLCLLVLSLGTSMVLVGCSSDVPGSTGGDGARPADTDSEATTTLPPPLIIGTAEDLGLIPGMCWHELEPATTTPTTELSLGREETTTTSTTPTTTTIPTPDLVAVVDCTGTNEGEVYGGFCIGTSPDAAEAFESRSGAQAADVLQRVQCPGDPELVWPGDREVRRAAARICLEIFSAFYQETYAVSERSTGEFTPNEGLWDLGERRVTCTSQSPPPTTTTTPSG